MMECESTSATAATTTGNNNNNKILTRREEIDSGIPWVEKYRPKRYVRGYSYNPLASLEHIYIVSVAPDGTQFHATFHLENE